jgi:tetratricopeptide (TPR) repeat protein
MASGWRTFHARAQRAYAHLFTGDLEKARADFAAALASDSRMTGVELAPLSKPFLQGFVDTVLPAIAADDAARAQEALDALVARLNLRQIAGERTTQAAMSLATGDARGILIEQLGGPLRLFQRRWQEKARTVAEAHAREAAARVQTLLAAAQQAVAAHHPEEAFTHYVRAYREASDRESRDSAIRGLASVLPLLPRPPEPDESVHRLVARARVFASDKDYLKAIEAYWDAIHAAPWLAQLHFDRALLIAEVARSKADFSNAIREMQRYILLAPKAADLRAAQDRIYEWEARAERLPQ